MRANWIPHVLLVGTGGFVGSVLRYLVSGLVLRTVPAATFPVGTVAVNLLGCFAIGVAGGLTESHQLLTGEARLFLLIGVLGGFTTFSTFGYETIALLRDASYVRAGSNILLHILLGLGAVWSGLVLTQRGV